MIPTWAIMFISPIWAVTKAIAHLFREDAKGNLLGQTLHCGTGVNVCDIHWTITNIPFVTSVIAFRETVTFKGDRNALPILTGKLTVTALCPAEDHIDKRN